MAEKKARSSKKLIVIVSLCAVAIMILSFFGGFCTHYLIQGKKINTLVWALKKIDGTYYYDEGDGQIKTFSAEDYVDAIMEVLLDDYSKFYTSEEYSDVIKTSKGNNFGSGIIIVKNGNVLPKDDPDLSVYEVSGNSPAYHAGIKAGDILLGGKVGDNSYTFTNKQEVANFLGVRAEGEEFTLTVKRGEDAPFDVTLSKRVFVKSFVFYNDNSKSLRFENQGSGALEKKVYDTTDAEFSDLDGDTAYIKLSEFDGDSASQFASAMDYMQERGKTKLVLDLRGNGGGYMDVLGQIASYLTYSDSGKTLIAVAKDKDGKKENFYANSNKFNTNVTKIIALADDNSASATECLLGAMLYYKRAFDINGLVIEGDTSPATTFGKGIMQTTYKRLLSGEAIKLTTAQIYQPDGVTTIHGKGIVATEANSVARGGALAYAKYLLSV